jgi:hypothetical protein
MSFGDIFLLHFNFNHIFVFLGRFSLIIRSCKRKPKQSVRIILVPQYQQSAAIFPKLCIPDNLFQPSHRRNTLVSPPYNAVLRFYTPYIL